MRLLFKNSAMRGREKMLFKCMRFENYISPWRAERIHEKSSHFLRETSPVNQTEASVKIENFERICSRFKNSNSLFRVCYRLSFKKVRCKWPPYRFSRLLLKKFPLFTEKWHFLTGSKIVSAILSALTKMSPVHHILNLTLATFSRLHMETLAEHLRDPVSSWEGKKLLPNAI